MRADARRAGAAPRDRARPGAGGAVRAVRLAAEGVDWLTASRVEVDRPGASYTVDTLEQLQRSTRTLSTSSCWAPTRRCAWRVARARARAASWRRLAVAERDGRVDGGRARRRSSGGGEARVDDVLDAAHRRVVDRGARARGGGAAVPVPGAGARWPSGSSARGSTGERRGEDAHVVGGAGAAHRGGRARQEGARRGRARHARRRRRTRTSS